MKRNREIKNDALNALDGHWGWAILVCLIYGAIVGLITAPYSISNSLSTFAKLGMFGSGAAVATAGLTLACATIAGIGSLFAINPLSVGYENSLKAFCKDGDIHTIGNMFKFGFAGGQYWRNLAGILLVSVFTFLWTLLFIVPGIIKSYAYAMTPYLLQDNPELGPNDARLKSIEIMRGHKGKLFGLDLSFIGWFLLGIISLGVGFIWIAPYYRTTRAAFYCNLKEELEAKKAQE